MFDDIDAAITKSDKKIEIDLIGSNWKKTYWETWKENDGDRDLKDNALGLYIFIY